MFRSGPAYVGPASASPRKTHVVGSPRLPGECHYTHPSPNFLYIFFRMNFTHIINLPQLVRHGFYIVFSHL